MDYGFMDALRYLDLRITWKYFILQIKNSIKLATCLWNIDTNEKKEESFISSYY